MAEPVEDLRGSLAYTTLSDVLQFLNTTGRTGELWVEGGVEGRNSQVYFERGNVYHAQQGEHVGIDALVEIIGWVEGFFVFSADKMVPNVSVEVNLQNALVEAARRLDERRRTEAERDDSQAPQRLLTSFADAAEVLATVLMTREGVVVAAANPGDAVDLDSLGSGLTALIDTIDRLGGGQGCSPFGGFFVEYDRFQVLCLPVTGTVLVVVAPGRAQLGVIRHKTQHLADALARVLPG